MQRAYSGWIDCRSPRLEIGAPSSSIGMQAQRASLARRLRGGGASGHTAIGTIARDAFVTPMRWRGFPAAP
jgi:hypothetical protein